MTLEDASRPQLHYARAGEKEAPGPEPRAPEDALTRALGLARELEELLEATRSVAGTDPTMHEPQAHSTRMARAMAASLVDELEILVRPARKTGVA